MNRDQLNIIYVTEGLAHALGLRVVELPVAADVRRCFKPGAAFAGTPLVGKPGIFCMTAENGGAMDVKARPDAAWLSGKT